MSFIAVGIMAGASIAGGIVKHSAAKKEEERAKKQAKKAKKELQAEEFAFFPCKSTAVVKAISSSTQTIQVEYAYWSDAS